jgi:hypothetical protein
MRDNSDKFWQIKTTERKILKFLYFFVSYFSTFVIICRCCLFVSLMSFNLEVPSGPVVMLTFIKGLANCKIWHFLQIRKTTFFKPLYFDVVQKWYNSLTHKAFHMTYLVFAKHTQLFCKSKLFLKKISQKQRKLF